MKAEGSCKIIFSFKEIFFLSGPQIKFVNIVNRRPSKVIETHNLNHQSKPSKLSEVEPAGSACICGLVLWTDGN